jgi:hypothetical protein
MHHDFLIDTCGTKLIYVCALSQKCVNEKALLCLVILVQDKHTFRGSHAYAYIQSYLLLAYSQLSLIVLSSITKKGEIVSTISHLWF